MKSQRKKEKSDIKKKDAMNIKTDRKENIRFKKIDQKKMNSKETNKLQRDEWIEGNERVSVQWREKENKTKIIYERIKEIKKDNEIIFTLFPFYTFKSYHSFVSKILPPHLVW